MSRQIYILSLLLCLGLVGNVSGNIVEQPGAVQTDAQIVDQMRDYCELVCDSWAGLSASYKVRENTQQVPVSVSKHIPVELKNRNRTICRSSFPKSYTSGESDIRIVRADKIYHVIALRRIII